MKTLRFSIIFLFLSFSIVAQAEDGFDYNAVNVQLNNIGKQLSDSRHNYKELQDIIANVRLIRNEATACLSQENETLKEQQALLVSLQKSTSTTAKSKALQDFQNDTDKISNRISECHVIKAKANTIINNYNKITGDVFKKELFEIGPRIHNQISKTPSQIKSIWNDLSWTNIISASKINNFSISFKIFILFIILSLLAFSHWTKDKIQHYLDAHGNESYSEKLSNAAISLFNKNIHLLIMLSGIFIAFSIHNIIEKSFYPITLTLGLLLLTYILMLLLNFIFNPPHDEVDFNIPPKRIAKKILPRSKIFLTLLIIYVFFQSIVTQEAIPISHVQFLRTLFIIFLSISSLNIIWLILSDNCIQSYRPARIFAKFFTAVLFGITITSELVGYYHLSLYIIKSVVFTLLSVSLAYLTYQVVSYGIRLLEESNLPWQINFRRTFGIKKQARIAEIHIMHGLLNTLIFVSLSLCIIKIWEVDNPIAETLLYYLQTGLPLFGFIIYPANIFAAFIVFIALQAITRFIRTYLAIQDQRYYEHGSKNAVASIVGYIGFSIAIISSLLVAGINLSGLAIVAGALSVGIGFGLQHIANNFISGIVLLLEQPIKIGDLISVGNVEGYVKSIRMRYTVIRTLSHTDLIVPNAQMVMDPVNNLMGHDEHHIISIKGGVEYGTDTQLVKRLLLESAEQHPEVLDKIISEVSKEIYTYPYATVNELGSSSISMELRCSIKDVNRRPFVISDLYQRITERFAEHDIRIAFPQRDLHFKDGFNSTVE